MLEEEQMKSLIVRFVREDEGQDLIEYAMLATVIALVVFAGASAAGNSLNTWYTNLGTTLTKWAANALK
jgi:pilus assembly protein Flp/PilA